MSRPFRVLSLDGGGIRGVIPAAILSYMESATGQPVSSLFDLIVGTSTGGILALALSAPDAEGKPKFTAQQLETLYSTKGGEIFKPWDSSDLIAKAEDDIADHLVELGLVDAKARADLSLTWSPEAASRCRGGRACSIRSTAPRAWSGSSRPNWATPGSARLWPAPTWRPTASSWTATA